MGPNLRFGQRALHQGEGGMRRKKSIEIGDAEPGVEHLEDLPSGDRLSPEEKEYEERLEVKEAPKLFYTS